MALAQGFTLVAELVVEEASFLGLKKLQSGIDAVADKADNLANSFTKMGLSLVMSYSGLGGGILGVLGKAIQASDKFRQSQLQLTNLLASNQEKLKGLGSFDSQMRFSEEILTKISDLAVEFNLDEQGFIKTFSTMSAALIPKHQAGENLSTAMDMTRGLMKSAQILGIDPNLVQGQLFEAISGSATRQHTIMRRLFAEAPEAFQEKEVKSIKEFNKLKIGERVEVLNKALTKFSNNLEVNKSITGLFSSQLSIMWKLFGGLNSVLKPLGDAIMPSLVRIFKIFNEFVHKDLRKLIEKWAFLLEQFLSRGLETIIEDFIQFKRLSIDLGKGLRMAAFGMAVIHIREFAQSFGKFIATVRQFQAIQRAEAFLGVMSAQMPFMTTMSKTVFGSMGRIWRALIPVLDLVGKGIFGVAHGFKGFLKVFSLTAIAFSFWFQVFSRALGKLKIQQGKDALAFAVHKAERLAVFTALLGKLMKPIVDGIDLLAGGLAKLLDLVLPDIWGDAIKRFGLFKGGLIVAINALIKLTKALITLGIVIAAPFNQIARLLGVMAAIKENPALLVGNKELFAEFMRDPLGAGHAQRKIKKLWSEEGLTGEERPVSQSVTNIGTMNNKIVQDFKEKQSPDRVAFSIIEHLKNAKDNPTGFGGNNFSAVRRRASRSLPDGPRTEDPALFFNNLGRAR